MVPSADLKVGPDWVMLEIESKADLDRSRAAGSEELTDALRRVTE